MTDEHDGAGGGPEEVLDPAQIEERIEARLTRLEGVEIERLPGSGWLALIGGGEFSFGETEEADLSWLAKTPPGTVGFLPTASASDDYGRHFAVYMDEYFERESSIVPVYRRRDALRGKNAERVASSAAVYVGGGVIDHLLDELPDSPVEKALREKVARGGVVVGIAAAAQAFGRYARSLLHRRVVAGLGWLPSAVVEPNFDPAHDRRLRQMLHGTKEDPKGARLGIGLTAGSVLLLGPEGEVDLAGTAFTLRDPDDDLTVHGL